MSEPVVKVKICGVTELHDAELAVALGAWAVGMVFHEASPRRCSTEQALRIGAALRRKVELCGVFVNPTLEELAHRSEELGLTLLQLHGDEGPAFCAEAARRTGARVIKAMQVSSPGEARELERFHVDFHLADARASAPARKHLRGGTGETFDWRLLAARHSSIPLILSGGLGPQNVAAAIAQARPWAVDSASGTESAPGHKDEAKLRAFFAAVQATGTQRGVAGGADAGDPRADSDVGPEPPGGAHSHGDRPSELGAPIEGATA